MRTRSSAAPDNFEVQRCTKKGAQLEAAGALLDNPASLLASMADVSLNPLVCNYDAASVGFLIRATQPLDAAP